jgi:hypothetical protein
MPRRNEVPVYRPYPYYAKLRDLGPVVWLPRHKVYALPRYAECEAVLLDDKTFVSGDGVALNPRRQPALPGHGPQQRRRRPRPPPGPGRSPAHAPGVARDAGRRGPPGRGGPDLVGWPVEGWENQVLPGSMGDDLLRAADAGELAHAECPALMIDYLAPSLDTTLSASALHLFATHPGLIPNAVNEIVRYESLLRAFSRKVARDAEVAGTAALPASSRVLVLYTSASSASATARTAAPGKASPGWKSRRLVRTVTRESRAIHRRTPRGGGRPDRPAHQGLAHRSRSNVRPRPTRPGLLADRLPGRAGTACRSQGRDRPRDARRRNLP